MKVFRIERFCNELASRWDDLVMQASNGHFLHTRRFLSYHRERFDDQSVLIFEGDRCLAVLPAAVDPSDARKVVSHPGATFGGIVKHPFLTEPHVSRCLQLVSEFFRPSFDTLIYKVVPNIYHAIPAQDDLYALTQLGARQIGCDLSATIDLTADPSYSVQRRKKTGGARRQSLSVSWDAESLPTFWKVLEDRLGQKYGAKPVHSLLEIEQLIEMFPANIDLLTVSDGSQIYAGLVLFKDRHVCHVQYMAATDIGLECDALSVGVDAAIEKARRENYRFFDFGTSTEDKSTRLNEGLHAFKSRFGAGTTIYQRYALDLSSVQEKTISN